MNKLLEKCFSRVIFKTANVVRRIKNPEKYKSLGFLCDLLGDSVSLNKDAYAIRDTIISEIVTAKSFYFTRNCACLVYRNPVYKSTEYHEQYALAAKKKGACVMISDRDISGYPCIISDHPISTYARLCRFYRDFSPNLRVAAVCGSIGKTTTKNMLAEVFQLKYKTAFTDSNLNTKESVGFAVQHISSSTEYMIQEIHEGEPGETQFISEMLCPDLLVLTPIDKSHLVFFESPEKIVAEVCSITKAMRDDGCVVVNVDDFDRFDLLSGKKVVSVSTKTETADFSAKNVVVDSQGIEFTVLDKASLAEYKVFLNNIYALHNVSSALLAFAAGMCADISPDIIIKGLSQFKTTGFRQNVLRVNDIIVYADCYNAAEKSMKSAIETSDLINVKGKRIAVLGDVEEAGNMSEHIHKSIAQFVNQSKFDILLCIGDKIKRGISSIALRDSLRVDFFDDRKNLTNAIKEVVHSGDLVLFKASHSYHLEECIMEIWPQLKKELIHSETSSNKWIRNRLFH